MYFSLCLCPIVYDAQRKARHKRRISRIFPQSQDQTNDSLAEEDEMADENEFINQQQFYDQQQHPVEDIRMQMDES